MMQVLVPWSNRQILLEAIQRIQKQLNYFKKYRERKIGYVYKQFFLTSGLHSTYEFIHFFEKYVFFNILYTRRNKLGQVLQ